MPGRPRGRVDPPDSGGEPPESRGEPPESGVDPQDPGGEPSESRGEPPESGVEQAARLARRMRGSTWLVVAALVVAGIAVTARAGGQPRGERLVQPAHTLGPEQGEQLGDPSAPVLVEEYGDFRCAECAAFQRAAGATVRQLADQGRIRFVFHQRPTLGRASVLAANAATCAGDAGGFWRYHDLLLAGPDQGAGPGPGPAGTPSTVDEGATVDRLVRLGELAGVGGAGFERCVRDGTYEPWLRRVTDQGSARGVRAVPTFYVGGERVDRMATARDLLDAVGPPRR